MFTNPNRSTKTFKFYTNQEIPAVGLGTWQSTEEEAYNAVLSALKAGYRHIDTAAAYGNEDIVGRAIKDSGIPRKDIFITTKLWCTDHTRPKQALQESLKKLGTEYVDLYLMHWPVPLNPNGNDPKFPTLPNGNRDILHDWDFIKTYAGLQELLDTGLTKSIGVSNFSKKNLQKLLEAPSTKVKPVVNQIEAHPLLPQFNLFNFCKENGIIIEAYSPLGSTNSPILTNETVVELAKKYGVQPATILISWAVWRGTVVLPKSVTPSRIESNFETVSLSDEDGEKLNKISEKGTSRLINPNWSPIEVFDEND